MMSGTTHQIKRRCLVGIDFGSCIYDVRVSDKKIIVIMFISRKKKCFCSVFPLHLLEITYLLCLVQTLAYIRGLS